MTAARLREIARILRDRLKPGHGFDDNEGEQAVMELREHAELLERFEKSTFGKPVNPAKVEET